MTTISIVIVNYNTCEELQRCLTSIAREDASEVIVVDNGSTDGSVAMVRACFPHVSLIDNRHNGGYGAGANQAIEVCQSDYVLLINSDTLLAHDTARSLRHYFDQYPRAAIVGPRLANPDGTLQPSCYPDPTPFNLFLEESSLWRVVAFLPIVSNLFLRTWQHDKVRSVPWVLGAAIAIRREAFQAVNGFDPDFFMYFEETDLCVRLRKEGWQIHFAPVTTIVHVGGASTSKHYAEMQHRLYRSTKLFYSRHFAAWQLRAYHLAMVPVIAARLARDLLRWRSEGNEVERERRWATIQVRYRLLRECTLGLVGGGEEKDRIGEDEARGNAGAESDLAPY